ncbi:MAG: bacteriocin family protein [Firmicutes bacterium]|jgi:uncharacterized linocin/CFP29 family protein|uniref:Type 1 encapsulin shell protein n=1 Tax=Sulfobacillus benefaciens TaxID=453960 RepID=A0A2T2X7V6_9FIRM|nr:bacteriocin family protein [Bacillota bacterium]MCL5014116.1 bacteriocin family protein [Bacillota bacterium]PSR30591.1 MAG: bacteriocin [Sulfobacillus benefaciens]
MDYLLREESPLTEREWAEVDEVVSRVIAAQIVGRRFLSLFGPMGPGVQVVPIDRSPNFEIGGVDMIGQSNDAVTLSNRIYQKVPMLHRDFILVWRDLETSRTQGTPLDWSLAEAAATDVALAEDRLIFLGDGPDSLPGLLNIEGRQVIGHREWVDAGSGFQTIVEAVDTLSASGFYPPYSVIVSPATFALWHRLYGNSGVLEVDQIRQLVQGGVYMSLFIPKNDALVVANAPQNLDLAVGLDTSVAFLESSAMNHRFRVLETLTLRVKRPGAVCHLIPLSTSS